LVVGVGFGVGVAADQEVVGQVGGGGADEPAAVRQASSSVSAPIAQVTFRGTTRRSALHSFQM
jgi:hypothetical protein